MESDTLQKSATVWPGLSNDKVEVADAHRLESTRKTGPFRFARSLIMSKMDRQGWLVLMSGFAILLGIFTTWIQVDKMGFYHLEYGMQIDRHEAVLLGSAPDPWQYRVLSEFAAEGFIAALRALGLSHPVGWGFVLLRIIQGVLIFALSAVYLRKLGFTPYTVMIGWTFLAWALTYSNYGADLQFSTYSDIIFYLLATVAIMDRKYLWVFPIMILAALNRETSGFIPFILLGHLLISRTQKKVDRHGLLIFGLSLLTYGAVFFGLRDWFAPRRQLVPPGMDLLVRNIADSATWMQLLATFTIIPLLALLAFRVWPRSLQVYFWIIVPAWVGVHYYASIVAETRLLLVPFILVLIPGALFGITSGMAWNPPEEGSAKPIAKAATPIP